MIPWILLLFLFAATPAQAAEARIFAPADAYLPGSDAPYYGSENAWDRRFFERQTEGPDFPGRRGQRQMLDLVEGRVEDAVRYCQALLEKDPGDLESLFNLAAGLAQLGKTAEARRAVESALARGLPFERFLAGPRDILRPLTETPWFRKLAAGRGTTLLHGPMVGCVTDRSASFWVRTSEAMPVQILASTSKDLANPVRSAAQVTAADEDFTAVPMIDELEPDTLYYYSVEAGGTNTLQPPWPSFRTYPAPGRPGRFRVGFGGGAGYVPEHERMWETLGAERLTAFLFMGDNVYIDLPQALCGLHYYTYYQRQSRPEYRRFISSTPIYAIWDDHDCAMDDVFMGPFADQPPWKRDQWELFRQNWNNPAYGAPDAWPGCWFQFSIGNVDFFMLDGRFYRTNPTQPNPTMLGPAQKQWLKESLARSRAVFKVLASPVPWAFDAKEGSLDTWNGFREEREEIFAFLADQRIEGVLLISADRHRSDVRKIGRADAYPLYELESSKLTNVHTHGPAGDALFAYDAKCSYGLLEFDTTPADPIVRFEVKSIDNEKVFSMKLRLSNLRH